MGPDARLTRTAVESAVAGLDRRAIADARWFGSKGPSIAEISLEEAFVLDDDTPHVLAIVGLTLDDGTHERYTVALTGQPLREARPGDGAWRALAIAMSEGRAIAGRSDDASATPTAVLVCRPGVAMRPGVPGAERDLGADQSNTSVVLGEDLLLKAYRRIQPGLSPELETVAFLSEEARFPAVPPLAGYAELVTVTEGTATIAIAQAFIADGADAYESTVEALTSWLLAPGEVSVEFATEIASDIGTLTAAMHAALANAHGLPDFEPREATADDRHGWSTDALAQLHRAIAVTPGESGVVLRELAPAITEALRVIEASDGPTVLTRTHGDFHLGQVLVAPDGYRIVDFEGEPTRTLDERRAHRSPLRDVASMLRSIDHAGRSAGRRAETRNGGPLSAPGLDLPGWLRRSRARFLEGYVAGIRAAGAPIAVDAALIHAFEVDKECYEFIYAATFLPSWLWAPTEGMRGLFETAQ